MKLLLQFRKFFPIALFVICIAVIIHSLQKINQKNQTIEIEIEITKEEFEELEEVLFSEEFLENIDAWIGTPYRWGGETKRGVDCSGFVQNVFRETFGIRLNRNSRAMLNNVDRVEKTNLETGDLVFFRNSQRSPVSHVGIYIGNDVFVHSASGRRKGVSYSTLSERYFKNRFYTGGRVKIEELQASNKTLDLREMIYLF